MPPSPPSLRSSSRPLRRIAHLHGFRSSPASQKGRALARAAAERGRRLDLLDMNQPSFERLTITAALAEIDRWYRDTGGDAAGRVCLSGSSLGGYLAALWASIRPERVDRLVLLCPALGILGSWEELVGEEELERWQSEGWYETEGPDGARTRVHHRLVTDAALYPTEPDSGRPTLILHGTTDDVVPWEYSERYARGRPHVRLEAVDDDHTLLATIDDVVAHTLAFFGVEAATR